MINGLHTILDTMAACRIRPGPSTSNGESLGEASGANEVAEILDGAWKKTAVVSYKLWF